MNLYDSIRAALLPIARAEDERAIEVTDWEETTENIGYCPTCYYEVAAVEITYRINDEDASLRRFVYRESFADLMKQLSA